ncbi:MAG: RNA-guided pseudouridylation complex pseudouridine synthase subunit Cbf5 [Nanoarchaeota archaeon]|nr:RNA-guided pseudouridylation complex pseudouridine synthase subunit Cbf5 [Nanoarchaeota archaeon]
MAQSNLMPFERIKRDVLVRKEAKTSASHGTEPEKRTTQELIEYGIINVDKPKGPSSHQVSAYVQKILGQSKSGHSGTLDPNVTGCLPVATGRATRIVQALLVAGKEYICVMHLHDEVPEAKIRDTMNQFIGRIKQLPPIKSAVKREWRFREIYYLEVLDIIDQDVLFKVGCQAGTYIRKLCHDIGEKMGTGAHMAELRRTKAGPFDEKTVAPLIDLQDAYWFYKNENNDKWLRKIIMPVEKGVAHLPKVWVMDSTVDALCHGADLAVPGIARIESDIELNDLVAVMSLKDELVALGDAKMVSKEVQKKEKGIAVRIHKVFMQPGTYPKMKREEKKEENK